MEEVLYLINEMSPFLLLGFFLAGIMHAFIPRRYYARYLSRPDFRSVVYATLIGIPLPLCSCGVIPTAMSMRKDGASKGAVSAFLICTPQTGIDSIIATMSIMGLPFAIIRPVAAFFTAIIGGSVVNAFDRSAPETSAASSTDAPLLPHYTFLQKMKIALRYAFVEMMEDIGKWLVIGLLIAGLITVFVPDSFFVAFQGNTWASMFLVMCLVLPMYLCATGSIPIAVALIMKGLTPGAGLLLLIVGPASNIASMLIVRKVMGMRTLLAYLGSIIVCSVFFGWLTDYLHFHGIVNFLSGITATEACCQEHTTWFSWICTVALVLLLIYALVLPKLGLRKKHTCHCDGHTSASRTSCSCSIPASVQVYHIKGMTCNHCRAAAQKAIENTLGVETVDIDLATREARITGSATRRDLANALSAIGFELED